MVWYRYIGSIVALYDLDGDRLTPYPNKTKFKLPALDRVNVPS